MPMTRKGFRNDHKPVIARIVTDAPTQLVKYQDQKGDNKEQRMNRAQRRKALKVAAPLIRSAKRLLPGA